MDGDTEIDFKESDWPEEYTNPHEFDILLDDRLPLVIKYATDFNYLLKFAYRSPANEYIIKAMLNNWHGDVELVANALKSGHCHLEPTAKDMVATLIDLSNLDSNIAKNVNWEGVVSNLRTAGCTILRIPGYGYLDIRE